MGLELVIITVLAIYLFGVSVRDIRCRQIYNITPLIILMVSPLITNIPIMERILGFLALFIPLFVINIHTNGFGMGDVKLSAAFGFMLGGVSEFTALALALLGAIIFGKITKNKSLPLAPFICGANMAVIIFMEVFLRC